jgi:ATP-dependent Clp protease adapter protein ClpS
MSHEFESTTESQIKPNLSLKEPPLFKVIYINDEVTTMEFVVDSLCEFFKLLQTFMPMAVLL